ncbi:hypothetical protein V7183_09600 [Bacillus sp. JJ1127]|uniref:hypothetical protein n=1 Tax=Bacillus sp. JJ1127 TaxID=3122952 RepID=UPI002FFE9B12
MTKGDAILRLLTEIKLEFKESRELMEQMNKKVDKIEKQIEELKTSKAPTLPQNERDWKYPSKMK